MGLCGWGKEVMWAAVLRARVKEEVVKAEWRPQCSPTGAVAAHSRPCWPMIHRAMTDEGKTMAVLTRMVAARKS